MGNNVAIGQYIQFLRKQKNLSQKELADILNTTTDKILSAGNLILRKTKRVCIADIREGFRALEELKTFFGENSTFYRGAIEGINQKMQIDIESYLRDEKGREYLLAEAVIQYITNGYVVDAEEIEECFTTAKLKDKIKRYLNDGSLFDMKSEKYLEYRPMFPQAAVDLIFATISEPIIADIGSGMGRLSGRCLGRAKELYAVEPNAQMRRTAEMQLSEYPNYHSVAAFAQQTSLPENSVDVITVASAYHWFDNEATRQEFRRILKKDGYVFLFWDIYTGNIFDSEKEIIDQKYRELNNRPASGIIRQERAENLFGKNKYQKQVFETTIYQSFEAFLGGWSSASYMPKIGTKEYKTYEKEARTRFEHFAVNGLLETKITTLCFYGQL